MNRLITAVWVLLLAAVVAMLSIESSRDAFAALTRQHPFLLGIAKIALLGTMGELLGGRIVLGRWKLRGIRLGQRVAVWGLLGAVFTVVFPLFSAGTEGLLQAGLLPGRESALAAAFWKSTLTNLLFGFPMMVFHRITDTLIDRGRLFRVWPLVTLVPTLDWHSLLRVAGFSLIWFWIPAHTVTFTLPAEFRVVSAALLAVVLGFILGLAKRLAQKRAEQAA